MIWEKRWFQFAILLTIALIWGSSFILMKIGLESFSNNQAAAIRIFLAALVLLPYSLRNIKLIRKQNIKSLLVVGFIGSFFPAFLFTKAQTRIDSSMAGMLNSLTPVFTLIVGILFHQTKFKWSQLAGLALGLTGAVGLITAGQKISTGSINSFAFFIVLATIFYGFSMNEIKSKLAVLTGVQVTSLSFILIGPFALTYLLFSNFSKVAENPDWPFHLAALATLAIIGTAFAMLLMNSLIRHTSPVFSSSVTYIIPVFAILWGVFDNEKITAVHLFFMAFILAGIFLINNKTVIKIPFLPIKKLVFWPFLNDKK